MSADSISDTKEVHRMSSIRTARKLAEASEVRAEKLEQEGTTPPHNSNLSHSGAGISLAAAW